MERSGKKWEKGEKSGLERDEVRWMKCKWRKRKKNGNGKGIEREEITRKEMGRKRNMIEIGK